MYKLIALDMDGTLFNHKKEITPRTKQALEKAKALGVKIVLASGRPLDGLMAPLKELDLLQDDQYVLSFNGGLVVNAGTKEIISKATLKGSDLKELVKLAKELKVHWHAFSAERGLITDEISTYTKHEAEINKIDITIVDPFSIPDEEDIVKVMFIDEPEILNPVIEQVPEWVTDKYNTFKSAPFFYEIMDKSVDKGQGLDRLAKYLGIVPEEVIACGDEENDYTMVKYAGLGVAMGNGIDRLKAIANYIADTNNYDGVGKVVEKFVIKPAEENI